MIENDGDDGATGKEGRYHHGDLRRALLDAALALVSERGVDALSLREVARRAGVSHNAPYHHFADRAALVEELVAESFDALAEAMRSAEAARAAEGGDPLARGGAVGVAYVAFAVRNPARFRLMFRPELRRTGAGERSNAEESRSHRAGRAAYQVLLDAVGRAQAAGLIAPGDPAPLALTAWSTVHGLAVLILDNPASGIAGSPEEAESVARGVTATLARGLLVRER